MTWHIITNANGTILAVYGSALLDMAQAKLQTLNALAPSNALHTAVLPSRPHVGQKYAPPTA